MKYNVSSFMEKVILKVVQFLFKTDNMIFNIHNIENINQFMLYDEFVFMFKYLPDQYSFNDQFCNSQMQIFKKMSKSTEKI